jgi:hypothetical protein
MQYLLDPVADNEPGYRSIQMVNLRDPELGELPAGVNYAEDDN